MKKGIKVLRFKELSMDCEIFLYAEPLQVFRVVRDLEGVRKSVKFDSLRQAEHFFDNLKELEQSSF